MTRDASTISSNLVPGGTLNFIEVNLAKRYPTISFRAESPYWPV